MHGSESWYLRACVHVVQLRAQEGARVVGRKEQEPNEAKTSLACDDRTTIFHHAPQFLRF
jgi:hypothetical protein